MARQDNFKGKEKETQFKAGQEQVEVARKGGIASGIAKRKKKTMQEIALMLLQTKVPNNKYTEEMMNLFPDIDEQELQYQTAILVSQIQKAVFKKDSKAAEFVRDTSGQKPVDRQEIGFAGTDRVEIKIDGEDVE